MPKKAYLIWCLVVALVISSWTVTTASSSSAPSKPDLDTNDCKNATNMLVGNLAALPKVTYRVRLMCDFDVRMGELNKVSDLDRRFITAAIASNMLEIQSLNFALGQAQNAEWRGLIQMMIIQHTEDLNMAMKIAKKIGANTSPDLTNMRVYPGTPDYDLGIRRVDLVAKFLNPLMSAGGAPMTPTVTGVPTDLTGTATGVATMDTTTPSVTSTLGVTSTTSATVSPGTTTPSATSTLGVTSTASMTPSPSTTTPSATSTLGVTSTASVTPSLSMTPSVTSTVGVTGTASAVPTTGGSSTPSAVPTSVTPIPTIPGGANANFDLVSLMLIEDEHVMTIETALAAERLVQNDEIRAFARHVADMAQLHLLLINDIQQHMLGFRIAPPPLDFQREPLGPRRFGPDSDDNK
ncbi:MAG TPA: hypothetical protein VK909_16485 [Anaerolineales bacterium]|nr:hypothetical protein [Anaerolineales bacterium]